MTTLFKKLNLKDHQNVFVLNAPDEFSTALHEIEKLVSVSKTIEANATIDFFLSFVTQVSDITKLLPDLAAKTTPDAVVWFAYPKQSSKKYRSELSRDKGWESVRELGLDTVRSVAIDTDWTGLRFRRNAYIKRAIVKS